MPSIERAPRRDAALNRAAVVSAAQTLFASDPTASIDAVARAAGLSRRTVYGHFADRDALIEELLLSGADRFNDISAGIENEAEHDAPLALARLTARLWSEAARVQVAAMIALDDAHVERTAEVLAPLRRRIVALVRTGQDAGTLRTDIAAPTLARLIEEAGRAAVTRLDGTSEASGPLAVRAVLGVAGLSWRETDRLLTTNPGVLD